MSTDGLQLARPTMNGSTEEMLDELDSILTRLNGAASSNGTLITEARLRATAALRAGGRSETARNLAILGFTADVLSALLVEGEVPRALIGSIVDGVANRLGLAVEYVEGEVCRRVLRDPAVTQLPVEKALSARLRALYFLAPVSDVSLWRPATGERPECVACYGDTGSGEARYEEARRVLFGQRHEMGAPRPAVRAVPILRGQRAIAALVVGTQTERDLSSLLREATGSLAPILETDALLARSRERERVLVESAERRLTRLGLDLHDGAIQELAVLAGDVRLFRDQLAGVLHDDPLSTVLVGRVDDLNARLLALDTELRGLARSYESPTILGRPFGEVLRNEVDLFRMRTEIGATLHAEGDFAALSASQRIALLRIVQEGLANIREHSGASAVRVSVVCSGGYTHAEIRDNGGGFDVERTLIGAVTSGRLGLVGMSERVRLLGGMFDVESRPGGPTVIRVTLPEWRPRTADSEETERYSTQERAQSS